MFNGDYSDFSAEWYKVVGITIFTTALINGISPVFSAATWGLSCCLRCLDRGCSFNKKKTKKVLQTEYEKVYTGGLIQYDSRYSVIIAMIWVIFMFSSTIPILYFAGFLLCLVMYWTDKLLFLKFYRLPPRHGSTLAKEARDIIEWSLLLHLGMGIYMLSNPDIFTSEEDDNKAVQFLQGYAKFIAIGVSAITGVDNERFGQVHIVFYCVGVGIFIGLFIIEKVFGFFSKCVGKTCCCCLNRDTVEPVFSNDIFKDIPNDQKIKDY